MKDAKFYSENGKKGALINKINRIKDYNDNPNYCKQCGKKIEIKDDEKPSVTRQRHYCSKECRRKHQSEIMSGNQLGKKYKISHCLNCGKELNKHQGKYCCNNCQKEHQYKQYIERWKSGLENGMSGLYQMSNYLIRYIKEKYDNKCCKCGWCEVNPTTGKIPLEIHHKDGDYTNNKEDNLELLCPNCHSLTSTYKNALNHKGRQGREKYYDSNNIENNESTLLFLESA